MTAQPFDPHAGRAEVTTSPSAVLSAPRHPNGDSSRASVSTRLAVVNHEGSAAETMGMSSSPSCQACGSQSMIEFAVFEHGTWVRKLTCWTCTDCRTVVAVPDDLVSGATA